MHDAVFIKQHKLGQAKAESKDRQIIKTQSIIQTGKANNQKRENEAKSKTGNLAWTGLNTRYRGNVCDFGEASGNLEP